jgi:hypothetical protein
MVQLHHVSSIPIFLLLYHLHTPPLIFNPKITTVFRLKNVHRCSADASLSVRLQTRSPHNSPLPNPKALTFIAVLAARHITLSTLCCLPQRSTLLQQCVLCLICNTDTLLEKLKPFGPPPSIPNSNNSNPQVQSIFDCLNLLPTSKCVLHYTIVDPSAPVPPQRLPAVKRARTSPPAQPKTKSASQSKQSSGPSSAPASLPAPNSSTPHTAPKRRRASADNSSPTHANRNALSSSSSSAAATRAVSARYPSPPRDIFNGGYGSGGTVGYQAMFYNRFVLFIFCCC